MADLSINLTLLVQMVNFLFAYFIISYFFLRPGYAVISKENMRVNHIKNQIIARQELIAHKQSHISMHAGRSLKIIFAKQKPDISQDVPLAHPRKKGVIKDTILSPDERKSLCDTVTTSLLDTIGRV